MTDVEPSESGLASGVVNTSFMMGGALGVAILASLAAARTDNLRTGGNASSPPPLPCFSVPDTRHANPR